MFGQRSCFLKTVAFITGKKNPAIQNNFIRFSIENFIVNISLYALRWPKLNFGCYLTFEIIFKALLEWKNELKFFGLLDFFSPINALFTLWDPESLFLQKVNIHRDALKHVLSLHVFWKTVFHTVHREMVSFSNGKY